MKLLALALLGLTAASSWAAAPANDNIASATVIAGSSSPAPLAGSNVGATKEPGEPAHAGNEGGASVWYTWTAPFSGTVIFSTEGSGFDTLLAAYTGLAAVNSLTAVAANDDVNFPADLTSQISFLVSSGTTYFIAVDGYGGASGPISLSWHPSGALSAGTFSWASPYSDGGTAQPLYVFSDLESFGPAHVGMHAPIPPLLTINRTGGTAGKVLVSYAITNQIWNDIVFTNFVGTNIISTNFTDNTSTNIFITNQIIVTIPETFDPVFFTPQNECPYTNLLVTNITITNIYPGPVVSGATNVLLLTNLTFPTTLGVTTNSSTTNGYAVTIVFSNSVVSLVPVLSANDQVAFLGGTNPLDFTSTTGQVTFIDFQTSATITAAVSPDFGTGTSRPVWGRNPAFYPTITAVQLDPLETTNISPPTIDPLLGTAEVALFNEESYGGPPPGTFCNTTNVVVNFEKSIFRVPESQGTAYIGVEITFSTDQNPSASVDYRIDFAPPPINSFNFFNNQPGSEYATPDPNSIPGSTQPPDLVSVTGTLSLTANNPLQFIAIPILDDDLVEFNEDFIVQFTSNPQVWGQVNSAIVTILFDDQPAGAIDRGHNPANSATTDPPFNSQPGANGPVYALAVQPDGKTVFSGDFLAYDTKQQFKHVGRMNIDGSPDTAFMAPPNAGADGVVTCLGLATSNNAIYIGGSFSAFDGTNRFGIARLNADGSLDTSFNPGVGVNPGGTVWALGVQQSDGKLLVAGDFSSMNATNRNRIARLNTDGSLDLSFDPGVGPDAVINTLALQPDGKVVIGGEFTTFGGLSRRSIARLNANGSLDTSFDPGVGADQPVYAIAVQPDTRIVIGGAFSTFNLGNHSHLTRLNADGSLDITFDPGSGPDDTVYSIVMQPDNTILLGGIFTSVNSTRRIGLCRLLSNGWVDTTFMDTAYNQFAGVINHYASRDIEPKNFIFTMGLQTDGKIMVGGGFLQMGGGGARDAIQQRGNIARVIGGSTPGPGNIGLATGSYNADENGGPRYITLRRDNGNLGPATVQFNPVVNSSGPGAAQYGRDFTFDALTYGNPVWGDVFWPNGTWMISVGETGANNLDQPDAADDVYINIIDNKVLDGNRTFDVQVSQPTGLFALGGNGGGLGPPGYGVNIPLGVALGSTVAPVTIVDNESAHGVISFSAPTYTVSENGTNAVITVTRTNGSSGLVTVGYSTANGTNATGTIGAVAGSTNDYIATSGQLNFGSGETVKTFSIPIVNNSVVQPNRTVLLSLFNVTGGGVPGLSNSVLTIIDDDFLAGRISFLSTNFGAHESDGLATITLTRSGGNAGAITISYTNNDLTATNGVNYNATGGTLHWDDGDSAPKTFQIPVIHDGNVTPNLTVKLAIFNPVITNGVNNTALGTYTNAVLTITNDDFYGSPAFSANVYSVNENGGSAHITVLRQGGSAQTISVPYSTVDATAVNGVDYNGVSGTLTFGPGIFAQSFDVPIIDNNHPDLARFLTLQLGTPSPVGVTNGVPSSVLLNIIDDETFNQPSGGLDPTYDPTGYFNSNVYAVALQSDNKILAGGDFTVVNSFVRNRIARLNQDGTLDVKFSSATEGANGSIRVILPQTDGGLGVPGAGRILVGGQFTVFNSVGNHYFARLNSDGSLDSSFNLGAAADNPVYAIAETFAPFGTNFIRKIILGGSFVTLNGVPRSCIGQLNDDGTVDQTFTPGLGANGTIYAVKVYSTNDIHAGKILIAGDFTMVNGIARHHIARLNADGTLDPSFDPQDGPNDSIRAVDIQVDGGIVIGGLFTSVSGNALSRIARLMPDGSVDPTFTPGPGADDVVLSVLVQEDQKIMVGGGFTHASGVTRNRLTRLNTDGTVDPTINFGLGANDFIASILIQPLDRMIVIGGGFTTYDGQSKPHLARVYGRSIIGEGALEFTSPQFQVVDNATNALITVHRTGGTGDPNVGDVFVTFQTSDGSGTDGVNYHAVTTNLDFPVGETFATVLVPVIDSGIVDSNRTVNLTLLNAVGAILGGQNTATLTILNSHSTVGFSSPDYRVARNVGNGAAIITVLRNGSSIGTATVQFLTTTNGTARPGVDYVPMTNTVVFADGQSSASFALPIINTNLPGGITVDMVLQNGSNTYVIGQDEATLTILDNSLSPGNIRFVPSGYVVDETATNAVITLYRTNGSIGQVSVQLDVSGGTAVPGTDYVQTNGSVVFADGETSKTFLVRVLYNPQITGARTVNLTLSNPSGGAGILGASNSVLTINDVDVGVAFSAPGYFVNETAGTTVITVVRVGGTNTPFDVNYATTNFTALAGSNYQAVSGALHFVAGETFKTFNIPILHDPAVQGNLVFFVGLSVSNSAAQLGSPSVATVTVIDTDSGLAFLSATNTVSESATNAVITVLRTGSPVGVVTVNFSATDTLGLNGVRYNATNGVLTFLDGVVTNSFLVHIINDNIVNGDQSINLALSNPSTNAQLLPPSSAILTIQDDDIGFNFSSANYTVNEGGVFATITVQRSGVTNAASVDFATSDGTAQAGKKYVPTSGTLFFTNGVNSQSFNVQIIDNNTIDGNETVILTLANPSFGGVLLNPNAATLTIIDNDGGLIVPAGSALIGESGPVNGVIDPGETVTNLFAFRDSAGQDVSNLVATLLVTNGVTNVSGPQTYGPLTVGGPSKSRPYSFTALGTNGGRILATFKLQDGTNTTTNSFSFTLGRGVTSLTNTNVITINDLAAATPYPSTNVVTGLDGVISKITIAVSNLAHTSVSDVGLLLVGPTGQKELLMANVATHLTVTNLTLSFDDSAVNSLPTSSIPTNGTYKPTAYGVVPNFPTPAPTGPYSTSLSGFIGTNPNGTWQLFVNDSVGGDAGFIAKGWSITLTTVAPVQPSADLSVGMTVAPAVPVIGSNFTYTVSVTNFGPAGATNAQVIDVLPAGLSYVSGTAPGGVVNNSNTVTLNFGTMATNTSASATITVTAGNAGTVTNTVTAQSNQTDGNPDNNTVSLATLVSGVTADLTIGVSGTPNPVHYPGNNITYTINVTNQGPATASGVSVTNFLNNSVPGLIPVTVSGNGATNVPGIVTWNIGSLGSGGTATVTLVARPASYGTVTNVVSVGFPGTDPLKGNNTASVKTEVDALQLGSVRGPGNLTFTWPAGYDLYYTASLTPPVAWTKLTSPAPVIVNGTNTVTISTTGGPRFFQVRSGP